MGGGATQLRIAWWPVLAVLVVIALLTGGWSLASVPLSDTEPVPAGSELSIGPSREAAVTVTDDGWQVRRSTTDPNQVYSLTRSDVDLSMSYAELHSKVSAGELWSGFRQVIRTNGGRLGEPSTTSTRAGRSGQSGPIRQAGKTGTAYAFPAPDGSFAIEFTVLSRSQASPADQSSAEQLVRSLTFPQGDS